MTCVFSLESLGFLNKEKNLDYRFTTQEASIKITLEEKKYTISNAILEAIKPVKDTDMNITDDPITILAEISKNNSFSIKSGLSKTFPGKYQIKDIENKLSQINDMLVKAAEEQIQYEMVVFNENKDDSHIDS